MCVLYIARYVCLRFRVWETFCLVVNATLACGAVYAIYKRRRIGRAYVGHDLWACRVWWILDVLAASAQRGFVGSSSSRVGMCPNTTTKTKSTKTSMCTCVTNKQLNSLPPQHASTAHHIDILRVFVLYDLRALVSALFLRRVAHSRYSNQSTCRRGKNTYRQQPKQQQIDAI